MSFPPHPRLLPRRRSVLASAAAATLLAGCSGGSDRAVRGGGSTAEARARAHAAGESAALAERYTAVLAAHPQLAARLGPLRAEVVQHVQAFGGTIGASGSPSGAAGSKAPSPKPSASRVPSGPPGPPAPASASGSAPASPGVPAPASPVPGDPKAALADLASAERALSDRRAKALLDMPGELARLMASVAAAGAAHGYLLTEGGT
ncbi:hypothetical protein AB0C59_33755 [Streptomyces sp. NPDC048664]|uniref:hypothetical protein n=1 Tax=Streptomyces sp. NPDC048664 TaxID=3154505 RepID=UPI0034404D02